MLSRKPLCQKTGSLRLLVQTKLLEDNGVNYGRNLIGNPVERPDIIPPPILWNKWN
jgi:hypothetical protein